MLSVQMTETGQFVFQCDDRYNLDQLSSAAEDVRQILEQERGLKDFGQLGLDCSFPLTCRMIGYRPAEDV